MGWGNEGIEPQSDLGYQLFVVQLRAYLEMKNIYTHERSRYRRYTVSFCVMGKTSLSSVDVSSELNKLILWLGRQFTRRCKATSHCLPGTHSVKAL